LPIGYDEGMNWLRSFSKRQKTESAVWLLVGIMMVALIAWRIHCDNVAYEALNPLHQKTGWHPRYAAHETALMLFGIFGAAGSFGAAIGALMGHQVEWTIAGITIIPLLVAFVSAFVS
jgi:hypothetical protein